MNQLVPCLCGVDEEDIAQISSDDPTNLHDVEPTSLRALTQTSLSSVALEHDLLVTPAAEDVTETVSDQLVNAMPTELLSMKRRCIRIERRIKHYSSSQKILLVGEGDFSFSACLALVFTWASNMVATSLDSQEFLFANYSRARSNIDKLKSRGCKVIHEVDATKMADNYELCDRTYDRIIYNFPLAGFFKGVSRDMKLRLNRSLIQSFLENAMEILSLTGEIHITHKTTDFYFEWNLQHLASMSGLRLIEEVPFNLNDYEGYNNKYGFGGDDNFNCNRSKTYKFGFKPQTRVK